MYLKGALHHVRAATRRRELGFSAGEKSFRFKPIGMIEMIFAARRSFTPPLSPSRVKSPLFHWLSQVCPAAIS
jgi:hypothetical protein